MDRAVYAVTVFDGDLIAGGLFNTAGAMTANKIASWDGSSWSAMGWGFDNGSVEALAVFQGELIAAGTFGASGGVEMPHIAKWDGAFWRPLTPTDTGPSGSVRELLVFQDSLLIVGGDFGSVAGLPASCIASWNGSSWDSLGAGTSSRVRTLIGHNDSLFAGGDFVTAGHEQSNYIARWCEVPATVSTETTTPLTLRLQQNFPNPFNPRTTLSFSLAQNGSLRLTIYDVQGQLIRRLLDGVMSGGEHSAVWDGRSMTGTAVASGVYIVRLESTDGVLTRKMVLSR